MYKKSCSDIPGRMQKQCKKPHPVHPEGAEFKLAYNFYPL